MPFVTQEHRDKPDFTIPGDVCFVHYKKLMDEWNKEKRWTNAHKITKEWFDLASDEDTAHFLAYMVWFNIHVMDYEQKKRSENGDVV